MTELKISTYNTHSCVGADGVYSIERISRVLNQTSSHIICLQEIEVNDNATQTRIWSTMHCDDQPASIASKLGFDYHVFAPAIRSKALSRFREKHVAVSSQDIVTNENCTTAVMSATPCGIADDENKVTGKFGIAILSRYPILQIQTHQYQQYKNKTIRNAVACLIALPNNAKMWVVNTHLGCHIWGLEQYHQARELVTFMESLSTPDGFFCGIVLCGDFNSLSYSSSIHEIRSGAFLDSWHESGIGPGATFPSDAQVFGIAKLFRLDYIFVKRCSKIVSKRSFVHDDDDECRYASDHLPLCTIFLVQI